MGRIKAFLLGGLIGAGAALVLAPQAGEKTRALVAEKAGALAGEAKDFGAGLPGSAQDLYKSLVDRGGSMVQDAGAATGFATESASKADQDELREKIEAARQRIAAQVMENAEKAQEAAAEAEAAEAEPAEAAADEAKHAK